MAYKSQHFIVACVAKCSMFDQLVGSLMDFWCVSSKADENKMLKLICLKCDFTTKTLSL